MSLPLSEVRAICRLSLPTATSWPDNSLDRWIGQAVRLYSAHFPRRWRDELALTTGTQVYALPGGHNVVRVLTVEYPAGREPRAFVWPAAEHAAGFESGGPYYAVRGVGDDVAGATDADAAAIVFAQAVTTGERALIETLGGHAPPEIGDDRGLVTTPAAHIEALTAYVQFAAQYELQVDAAVTIDGSSVVVSQLGEQARRAWNRYKEVMDRLVYLAGLTAGAGTAAWGDVGL